MQKASPGILPDVAILIRAVTEAQTWEIKPLGSVEPLQDASRKRPTFNFTSTLLFLKLEKNGL